MHNKELNQNNNDNDGLRSRIGGYAIGVIEGVFLQPIEGEPTEGFKKFIGTSIIGAGAVVSMVALDKVTGLGVNPLNYALALHQVTTY